MTVSPSEGHSRAQASETQVRPDEESRRTVREQYGVSGDRDINVTEPANVVPVGTCPWLGACAPADAATRAAYLAVRVGPAGPGPATAQEAEYRTGLLRDRLKRD